MPPTVHPAKLDSERHQRKDDDMDCDDRVLSWIPAEGIDFDVLANDLNVYLDPGATVQRRSHPNNVRGIQEMAVSELNMNRMAVQDT